jgi:hypothetical protein
MPGSEAKRCSSADELRSLDMPHYAEAFCVIPGQCFRFVHSGFGHAIHCHQRVASRGRFKDRAGMRRARRGSDR